MEVIAFGVLSAVVLNVVCIISFIFYKRTKKTDSILEGVPVDKDRKNTTTSAKKNKPAKERSRKIKNIKKPQDGDTTGTESSTTEEQLRLVVIEHQKFNKDSINTTALDEKPNMKRLAKQRADSKAREGSTSQTNKWDPEWENVTSRRKKKVYLVTEVEGRYEFTLDADGGIVELPFCEIHFPAESVHEALVVSVGTETHGKFVDDTEDKVFVTPAVHFKAQTDGSLLRRFVLKLHSMKMMGKGWNRNVCCQIERKESVNLWTTIGRTEFIQGMPVNIVGDRFTSFRAVITRVQSSEISRNLNVAVYIAKPKISNPKNHFLHVCIYDNSQQTQFKVQNNMQKLLLKMQPKLCNIPFGCNVEFKLEPTQKYTPDEKEIFMRWTEVCKAFVNVRFQIKLSRSESVHPNFEPQYRTMVFLSLNKVGTTQTWKQQEYFYFYWISGNFYPKMLKFKGQKKKSDENETPKISGDDATISGSIQLVTQESVKTKVVTKPVVNSTSLEEARPKIAESKPPRRRNKLKKGGSSGVSTKIDVATKRSNLPNEKNSNPLKRNLKAAETKVNDDSKTGPKQMTHKEAKLPAKYSSPKKIHQKREVSSLKQEDTLDNPDKGDKQPSRSVKNTPNEQHSTSKSDMQPSSQKKPNSTAKYPRKHTKNTSSQMGNSAMKK